MSEAKPRGHCFLCFQTIPKYKLHSIRKIRIRGPETNNNPQLLEFQNSEGGGGEAQIHFNTFSANPN